MMPHRMSVHHQESWFRAITRSAAQIRKRFGVTDQLTEDRMVRAFRAAPIPADALAADLPRDLPRLLPHG